MNDIQKYIGKTILVGLSFVDANDQVVAELEKYGIIIRIEDDLLTFEQTNGEGEFSIPFDEESIYEGKPGAAYRLKTTGEVVQNVDYLSAWTIQEGDR